MRGKKLIFAVKSGMIKLVDGAEFDVSKRTTAATKLADGDDVVRIEFYEEEMNLVFRSKKGMFLRILADGIPEKKKGAIGVRGIRLAAGDELEEVYFLRQGETVTVSLKGKGLELNRLRIGNRDTKGVRHG